MHTNEPSEIILQNSRLRVELAQPGTFYNGSRFDHNGFITGVVLDGRHTFCVPESMTEGEGSGGCGFCGEFGIDEAIGYDETQVGASFLKVGVGQIKRPDDVPYNFFRPYEFLPAASELTFGEGSVTFAVRAESCNGYAYAYQKTVRIQENRMTIAYTLENTGAKRITTTEYCHNFVGINRLPVNGGYQLAFSNMQALNREVGNVYARDGVITWPDEPMEKQYYCQPKAAPGGGYCWRLVNRQAGVGVSESDNFTPCKLALWGYRHVVSPEVFVRIDLAPGETQQWARTYEFFDL